MIKLRKSSVAAISRLCSYSVVILFLILFSSSVKASCEYELISPGDFNSTARITLINTGSTAVSAWDITWTYVDTGIDVFNVNYDNANSTNSVNNTSFILDESSNPTITATAPNFNASNIVDFTLDPGDVAVLEVRTNGIVNGGSGLIVPGSLTGALCGQSVVSQSLTIVKEVINDNSGTSVVTDFGIATNAGSPISFVASSTSNNITTYTSDPITVSPGTYSLSENDLTDYNEGSWVCTGAAGAVVDTFNAGSVVIADGETVICTIVNDDVSPIIPLPTEVPATSCLDNSQLRAFLRAADWNSNDTNPAAGIVNQPAVFLTASDFVAGPGINISFPFSRTEISGADQANFSSAYMAGDYIEYTVETIAGLGNTSAISGIAENLMITLQRLLVYFRIIPLARVSILFLISKMFYYRQVLNINSGWFSTVLILAPPIY